jgi:large subunit ribosomal protein L7/L12
MADVKDLAEQLVNLTVKEANELKQHLKDEYGLEPAATAVAAPAGGAAGGDGAADGGEEKTEFDVVLTGVSGNKIAVIKEVRNITNMGLKEAKALVDEAPNPIREGVPREEADELKAQLEDAGGEVELQ